MKCNSNILILVFIFFVSIMYLIQKKQNKRIQETFYSASHWYKVGEAFEYAGEKWPLPQTGQMWLEYEMLKNPAPPGYFCISTSYRQEPDPVPGRHDLIFPLFEFEMKGGMEELIQLEKDLLKYLGYDESKFIEGKYQDVAKEYGVEELENEHEMRMYQEKTPTFFLKDFPEFTSPFWNMKRYEGKHSIF